MQIVGDIFEGWGYLCVGCFVIGIIGMVADGLRRARKREENPEETRKHMYETFKAMWEDTHDPMALDGMLHYVDPEKDLCE